MNVCLGCLGGTGVNPTTHLCTACVIANCADCYANNLICVSCVKYYGLNLLINPAPC